jgi:spore coat polysaccharide biosynthesis predicted glycosyltransferase SpsG
MGGSDLTHQTLKVLSALQQVGDPLEVQVVAGAGNDPAYLGEIEAAARSSASHDVRVAHAVTDMARRMSWADLAITAAGSTCLELSCVGVPAIALATADNQRRVAEGCASRGLMVSLGWHEAVTPDDVARELNRLLRDDDARASMVHSQHLVVDGRGKERVARALLSGLDL